MPKNGDFWFKFRPENWLRDTRILTLEQRGAYIDLICLQWRHERAVDEDYKMLGHALCVSSRKARALCESLIESQLINRLENTLSNPTAQSDIEHRKQQRERYAEAARARAEKSKFSAFSDPKPTPELDVNSPRTDDENHKKSNEINKPQLKTRNKKRVELELELEKKERYSPKSWISDPPKPIRNRVQYTQNFEVFWKAYPDTKNNSKSRAFSEWKRLSKSDRDLASASLRAFHAYCRDNPDYPVLHAERYLKHRRFEGYADEQSTDPFWKDPEKLALITDQQWEGSIRRHANGTWPLDKLGHAPEHPDSVAPKHVVKKLGLDGVYDKDGLKRW